jgi:5'-3' exoribonuclease 1
MGIPKFFRWLSERYPLINQTIDLQNVGPIFDNLYLDMNGIIHHCTHPSDDISLVLSQDEMFTRIFRYVDHIFHLVKPRKIFYLAIDGVAPRAKMNQQRQRRFRSAKEAREAIRRMLERGERVPETPFDSNCITPGTEFMQDLTKHLKFFIRKKINEDPAWRKVKIIFSGHEVSISSDSSLPFKVLTFFFRYLKRFPVRANTK